MVLFVRLFFYFHLQSLISLYLVVVVGLLVVVGRLLGGRIIGLIGGAGGLGPGGRRDA